MLVAPNLWRVPPTSPCSPFALTSRALCVRKLSSTHSQNSIVACESPRWTGQRTGAGGCPAGAGVLCLLAFAPWKFGDDDCDCHGALPGHGQERARARTDAVSARRRDWTGWMGRRGLCKEFVRCWLFTSGFIFFCSGVFCSCCSSFFCFHSCCAFLAILTLQDSTAQLARDRNS